MIENKAKKTKMILHIIGVIAIALFLVFLFILLRNEYMLSREELPAPQPEQSAEPTAEPVEVDETVPTEQQVVEYTVAPERPRYLSIPQLGINKARVLEVGVDKNDALDTPINIFDVGWLGTSGKPGGGGTMLMDGHNGGPTMDGVFKRLGELTTDDLITIERGDGQVFKYKVVENQTMGIDDANNYMSQMLNSAEPGKEGLNLITCIGTWLQRQQTYDSRVMLRAVLVE